MPEPQLNTNKGTYSLPAAMLRAMGFLIAASSGAEYMLGTQILRLISEPYRSVFHAYPLVAGLEAKVKITMIRIFLKMFGIDSDGRVNLILDQIGSMFDRRNEIAHSVPIGNPRKPGQIRFQDLRARIKLGEMPQPQVRTAKEISGYGRKLLRLCGELERALTQRGVLTLDQLHAIERANLELAAQMAHSQGDHRPPHSTKRKTPRQPAPSKGPERA